jgi:hypothetical protein
MGILDEKVLDGLFSVSKEFPDSGAELYCLVRKHVQDD